MINQKSIAVRNAPKAPRVSKAALQERHRTANYALKKYEMALRFTDDIEHSHLAQNLRARLNREEGTCQSFWWSKVRAKDNEDSNLFEIAQAAFELVTEYRSIEAASSMPECSQEARELLARFEKLYGDKRRSVLGNEAFPVVEMVAETTTLPSITSRDFWILGSSIPAIPTISINNDLHLMHKDSSRFDSQSGRKSRPTISRPRPAYDSTTTTEATKRVKRIHPPMLAGEARDYAENAYVAYQSQLCGAGSSRGSQIKPIPKFFD